MNTGREEPFGHPVEAATQEITNKICDLLTANGRLILREIFSTVDLFSELVYNIVHQQSNMTMLLARRVPRLLTIDQKRERVRCSRDGL